MSTRRNTLFHEGSLHDTLELKLRSIPGRVERIPRDQFLASSVDTLVEHLQPEFTVESLEIHEDRMSMEDGETKIDVTGRFDYGGWGDGPVVTVGHRFRFYLPFSGDPTLWKLRPNSYSSMPPHGTVDQRGRILTIELTNTSNTAFEQYERELQSVLGGIRQYLGAQRSMIDRHNNAVPSAIRESVTKRKAEVQKLHGLASAFNIPLVKKPGMPTFTPVEVKKKIVRTLPPAPVQGVKREPAISDEMYEEILAIIRHMGATFEAVPQTYMTLGEEGLRDILLASLNGMYAGAATAEAFRKYGKTDIRIEEETRAAFVGECKLWGGEKVLIDALDQLLGRYLLWRDVKTALIVFNKDVGAFTGVQQAISASLPKHPLYLRDRATPHMGEWRADFRSVEDPGLEIRVHVFAFNLYVSPPRSAKKR